MNQLPLLVLMLIAEYTPVTWLLMVRTCRRLGKFSLNSEIQRIMKIKFSKKRQLEFNG